MPRKIVANNRYLRDIADDTWRVILQVYNESDIFVRDLGILELRRDTNGCVSLS